MNEKDDKIPTIDMAFRTLESVGVSYKIAFQVEFIPTKKLYRVRVLSRQFLDEYLLNAMTAAIKFIAVAERIMKPEDVDPAPPIPHETKPPSLHEAKKVIRDGDGLPIGFEHF